MKFSTPQLRHSLRGLTLLELLSVITVVTILTALIIPAVGSVRKSAQAAGCLSNVRSYGQAILSYAVDNGGLPVWEESESSPPEIDSLIVPTYLQKSPRCPMASASDLRKNRGFFYAGFVGLSRYYPKLTGLPVPSSRVALASEMYAKGIFYVPGHLNRVIWGTPNNTPGANEGTAQTPQYHGRPTSRGLNMMFLDGHAAPLSPTDGDWYLPPTYGSLNSGQIYDMEQLRKMKKGTLP